MEFFKLFRVPDNHPVFNTVYAQGYYTLTQLEHSSINYAITLGYIQKILESKQAAFNYQICFSRLIKYFPNFPNLKSLFNNLNLQENYLKDIEISQLKSEIFYLSELLFNKDVTDHQNFSKFSQDFNCKIKIFQENQESVYDLCRFTNFACVNILVGSFDGHTNYYYLLFKENLLDEHEKSYNKTEVKQKFIYCCKKILESSDQRKLVRKDDKFVPSDSINNKKEENLNESLKISMLQGNSLNTITENPSNSTLFSAKSLNDENLGMQVKTLGTCKTRGLEPPRLLKKNKNEKIESSLGLNLGLGNTCESLSKSQQTFPLGLKMPNLIKNQNFGVQIFKYNEKEEVSIGKTADGSQLDNLLQNPRNYNDYMNPNKNLLKSTDIEEKKIEFISQPQKSNKLVLTQNPSNKLESDPEVKMDAPMINNKNLYDIEQNSINIKYLKIPEYDPKSKPAFNKHPNFIIIQNSSGKTCKVCKAIPQNSQDLFNCNCTICTNCLQISYATKQCTICQSPLSSYDLQIIIQYLNYPLS